MPDFLLLSDGKMHFSFDWFQIVQAVLAITRLFQQRSRRINYYAEVCIHYILTAWITFRKCKPRIDVGGN